MFSTALLVGKREGGADAPMKVMAVWPLECVSHEIEDGDAGALTTSVVTADASARSDGGGGERKGSFDAEAIAASQANEAAHAASKVALVLRHREEHEGEYKLKCTQKDAARVAELLVRLRDRSTARSSLAKSSDLSARGESSDRL